ncbi:hypothetical protein [Glycomyces sp. NPDC048151]|uniref:hypothetical protein n=1 Tax=Glycomyces sp. NPDC048151 TaxID=3364002 RepID=UPI00371C5D81
MADPDNTNQPSAPADPTQQPGDPAANPAAGDPQPQDEPLGEGGKRALEAERKARSELEKQLKDLSDTYAPLKGLVEAIRGGKQGVADEDKTDVERLREELESIRAEADQERLSRLRLEVATEAGLTAQQAARLQGTTREELAADAAALKELFPAVQEGPRRPAPDPTQGGRGAPPDLQTQIAAAEKAGDWQQAMALKNQMLIN